MYAMFVIAFVYDLRKHEAKIPLYHWNLSESRLRETNNQNMRNGKLKNELHVMYVKYSIRSTFAIYSNSLRIRISSTLHFPKYDNLREKMRK